MTRTQKAQIELAHTVLWHMKEKGWTKEVLAKEAGLDLSEIDNILSGEFDFGLVGKIMDEFNLEIVVINTPKYNPTVC